jgi:MFS transporter, UMF1 family
MQSALSKSEVASFDELTPSARNDDVGAVTSFQSESKEATKAQSKPAPATAPAPSRYPSISEAIELDEPVERVNASNVNNNTGTNSSQYTQQGADSPSQPSHNLLKRKRTAPAYLRWIEYPFHVANPTTHQKLPEACGWAMDAAARGPLYQVGSYVGAAVLRMASLDAGCPKPSDCTNRIYGFRPSSLLTLASSIVGVSAALLMPIVGAVVDHTTHRRRVGLWSGVIAIMLAGLQLLISQRLWLFCLCVDAVQAFVLLVHLTAVFAYLPDLSLHEKEISHYTAHFNLRQYTSLLIFVSLIILSSVMRGENKSVIKAIRTAKDAAGIAFGVSALLIPYAWIFLFRPRPALTALPPNSSLLIAGFLQVGRTARKVVHDYRALRWFMFSLLWSPEAGAGVIQGIAVTYLTVVLNFTGQDLAQTTLLLMAGNMIGSLVSKRVIMYINPLQSYRLGLVSISVTLIFSAYVLVSPEQKMIVYGMAVVWGVAMGWTYPSQRVLFCTLMPKGQETEMMGLFVFMGQILGWLPPLIVTIMNENEISMQYSLFVIPCFCLAAFLSTLCMGNYQDAVDLVARDSREKLQAVVEAATRGYNTAGTGPCLDAKMYHTGKGYSDDDIIDDVDGIDDVDDGFPQVVEDTESVAPVAASEEKTSR